MVLDIKKFELGKCFICSNLCESYAHFECCVAYSDEKSKRCKEAQEKKDGVK